MRKGICVFLCSLTVLSLTACGGSSKNSGRMELKEAPAEAVYEEAAMDYAENGMGYDGFAGATNMATAEFAETEAAAYSGENEKPAANPVKDNRKLIRNTYVNVETKEFDTCVEGIQKRIKDLGGYVQNMDGYYGSRYETYRSSRNMHITARIPADRLDSFIDAVGEISNIVNRSESVEDVTLQYVDMESHKKMLKEEQNRLMEFLGQAETIEEIISIEDRLTQVKYQLDSMESQLRTFDNQVYYATANIDINEVVDYTETPQQELTPLERMGKGFVSSLKSIKNGFVEFGIWFVVSLPFIVVWAIVIIAIILIVRLIIKKNKARMEKIHNEHKEKKQKINKEKKDAGIFVNKPDNIPENTSDKE